MDIKKGIIWTGSLRIFTRGLTIVKTIVLARLLTPFQFGIFGIASLVLGLLEMITETGVNVVLIQEKNKIDKYLNTGWVVSIVRGIMISLLIIIFTPLITSFFSSPYSKNILYLISIIPFIRGFVNPAIINYQKDLKFDNEFKFRSIVIAFEVFATVVFGIILRNENAFVWGLIVSAVVEVILSFTLIKLKPKFEFNIERLKFIISGGRWVTGAKIFDYLFSHGDDIVVGKLLGTYSLGIYQQAYRISSLPIIEVSETFQKVTFPTYSKMIDDNKEGLQKTYSKTLIATLFLIVPIGLILFIFPTQVVLLLLGSNWLTAVPVLKVLAIFGVIKTIANSAFPLLLAKKRQDVVMLLTFVGILGLAISIFPLISLYGLVGAGISTIIGSLVMIPLAFYWIRKMTND